MKMDDSSMPNSDDTASVVINENAKKNAISNREQIGDDEELDEEALLNNLADLAQGDMLDAELNEDEILGIQPPKLVKEIQTPKPISSQSTSSVQADNHDQNGEEAELSSAIPSSYEINRPSPDPSPELGISPPSPIQNSAESVARKKSVNGDSDDIVNIPLINGEKSPSKDAKSELAGSSSNTDDTDDSLDSEKEKLLTMFLEYCKKFDTDIPSMSMARNDVYSTGSDGYRLSDLLKWFVEDMSKRQTRSSSGDFANDGPLTFKKRVEATEFTVPISITLPPSQVVDVLVEVAPEKSFKDLCGKGTVQNADASETIDRSRFTNLPAPNMSRFLHNIGLSLATESAYRSVLNKAVSELASATANDREASVVERQSQLVDELRRVFDNSRKHNAPLKLRMYKCPMEGCNFSSDTEIQMYDHRRRPHKQVHRWACALCMKFSSYDEDDVEEHYEDEHGFTSSAILDHPAKFPCPFCDRDFARKNELQKHIRTCSMNVKNPRLVTDVQAKDILNIQLWPKTNERQVATTSPQKKPASLQAQQKQVSQYYSNALKLPPLRPKTDMLQYKKVQGVSPRVSDVVSRVASGQGQLQQRSSQTSALNATAGLPRIIPTVARTMSTTQQEQYQQRYAQLLRLSYSGTQQNKQRPSILAQAASSSSQTAQRPIRPAAGGERWSCEICDAAYYHKAEYLKHLQMDHRKLLDKPDSVVMVGAAPLACSRCRDRFYSYEGLERHLLMEHSLVTNELYAKAQAKHDSGKCKVCTRIYAFNLLTHLVQDHHRTLCSAEIVYSCDVCLFQCNSYVQLELHLRNHHNEPAVAATSPTSALTVAPANTYTQASTALSMIAQQRQQQAAMLVVTQPPRSGQQPSSSGRGDSVANILQSAMNSNKRPAAEPLDRPPKLVKMTETVKKSTGVAVSARPVATGGASARPTSSNRPQQPATLVKKALRYCCTPCELKFISYEAVLKHWVERHLKPLRVPLCRIDRCQECQRVLTEPSTSQQAASEDGPSCSTCTGLKLDLTLPEPCEEEVNDSDGDVEILPPPTEIICLDDD